MIPKVLKRFTGAAVLASAMLLAVPVSAQAPAGGGIAGLTRTDGYIPFYFDTARNRVLMEIPVFDQDILYYISAATNPGSVEAPFDRGVVYSAVIHFERSGGKVVVNKINVNYRATNGSPKTQEGVADSFPTSVLAVLNVESDAGGSAAVGEIVLTRMLFLRPSSASTFIRPTMPAFAAP